LFYNTVHSIFDQQDDQAEPTNSHRSSHFEITCAGPDVQGNGGHAAGEHQHHKKALQEYL